MRPRIFSSRLSPTHRRVYRSVLVFFAFVFLAMIWPLVVPFSQARPLVFGLPFFLFYLTSLLLTSFIILLVLYLWEGRTTVEEDPQELP